MRSKKRLLRRVLEAEELLYLETGGEYTLMIRGRGSLLTSTLLELATTFIGVLVLAASARSSIALPFTPVPFTLQTLVLALIILLRGSNAWRTVVAYVLLGLAGLPVFAYGGGLHYILLPTFGYIIGFTAASLLGFFNRGYSLKHYIVLAVAVNIVVYACGWLWLSAWLTLLQGFSFMDSLRRALLTGVAPFILWDLFKALIAAPTAFYSKPVILKLKLLIKVITEAREAQLLTAES